MHRVYLEENVKSTRDAQRKLNPNMKKVVKAKVIKILDVRVIYLISDNS